jgi:MFS family permease
MATVLAAGRAVGGSAALAPLRIRDFRLFWSGNLVSQCGDQLQIVGLAILALNLTHDPATLGAVLAAQAIPRAIFMLVGGVLIDRFRATGVLRVTNLLMMLLVGLLATLTAFRLLALWHLYVYAVLAGLVSARALPAYQSVAVELVPAKILRNAIALNTTSFNTIVFLVPPFAGLLVAHLGSAPAFALDSVSFGVAAVCLYLVRGGQSHREPTRDSPFVQLGQGLRVVSRSPLLSVAVLSLTVYSLGYQGANLVGVPTLAKLTLDAGDAGVGFLYGVGGAGALLAALGMGLVPRIPRLGLLAALALSGSGVGLALVALAPNLQEAALALFLASAVRAVCPIAYLTLVQTHSPVEARGRVMALLLLGVVGLEALSLSIDGLLGAIVGGRGIFLACAIVIVLAGAVALANREFREAA